jgi:hypothetical protein
MRVPEQFRVPVIDKDHTEAHPQYQKRQRPQLFHPAHADFSLNRATRDNSSTVSSSSPKMAEFK